MERKALIKNSLLFIAGTAVIFFAFYGIKSEEKEFLVDDVEKNLEVFEESGSFAKVSQTIPSEFTADMEQLKAKVQGSEDELSALVDGLQKLRIKYFGNPEVIA